MRERERERLFSLCGHVGDLVANTNNQSYERFPLCVCVCFSKIYIYKRLAYWMFKPLLKADYQFYLPTNSHSYLYPKGQVRL